MRGGSAIYGTNVERQEVMALFDGQAELIRALEARIHPLEDQLAKNSQNSSKPPSSDGLNKSAPKSRRETSGKPSGGQRGHVGHRLEPVDQPQHTKAHPVTQCAYCQAEFAGVDANRVGQRQVVD